MAHHNRQTATTFQSTPSAWRVTALFRIIKVSGMISIHTLRMEGDFLQKSTLSAFHISIHTLRMEGDSMTMSFGHWMSYFNPHPPHGG